MKNNLLIIKRDHVGKEVWRYPSLLIQHSQMGVLVEALFNRDDLPFHGLIFKRNDRFLELYLYKRWFNIFAIHDRDNDALKGFYCNVTHPALISDGQIAYDDLALDLLVYPNGNQLVLDEDEFNLLPLSTQDRECAKVGLLELQDLLINPAQFSFSELLGRD